MHVNIHHLELFYYVAKHGGITRALKHLPYGIQQPAVSGQLLQLEKSLGLQLFQRRPFLLTAPGRELQEFITPFFNRLPEITSKLRGESGTHLRMAAASLVLRDHVPFLLRLIRQDVQSLRLTLFEAGQSRAQALLMSQEVDLAVSVLEEQLPQGLNSRPLLQLPMVLLVGKQVKPMNGREWFRSRMHEKIPLIAPPGEATLMQLFQRELGKRRIRWATSIRTDSVEVIQVYAAEGFGAGLTLDVPGMKLRADVQRIPLPDFPKVKIGAFWVGNLPEIAEKFITLVAQRAKNFGQDKKE